MGRLLLLNGCLLVVLLELAAPAAEKTNTLAARQVRPTPQQTRWLAEHPVIRIAPTPDYRPIEYFDAAGRYVGITADYFEWIEQHLGFRFNVVKPTQAQWQELDPVKRGADVITCSAETPLRQQYWLFTRNYLTLPTYVITRTSAEDGLSLDRLAGMRVAVVRGWAIEEFLRTTYPNLQIDPMPDAATALQKVSFGLVDAFVSELPVATAWMEEKGLSNLKISAEADYTYKLGIAVRKDWPELREILDDALAALTPEERTRFFNRWVKLKTPLDRRHDKLGPYVAWGTAGLLALLASFIVWNRQLASRVRASTSELRGELVRRSHAEDALRASEERLRIALDSAQMGIFDWDIPQKRINWSRWHEELWGYAPGEFDGSYDAFIRRLHPDDLARVEAELIRCVMSGHQFTCDYRVLRPEGGFRWIASTGQVAIGSDRAPARMRGTVREITERKQAEATLQESEARYRFLFEHNPLPMLIYERGTLQMLAVNEAFIGHYGYSREEALGMRLTELYPADEQARLVALLPTLQGHANVGEWHHRRRDGTFITVVAFSHDLTHKGRQARVAVLTDITDRKRAEEELQAARSTLEDRVRRRTSELAMAKERAESADRLKSAFLATMSHELRTPLNSIIGFTGILLQGLAGPLNSEQAKQLGMVKSSAKHLLALINDVLDISKIEAGQIEIRSEPFDLRATLDKVAAIVRPLAEKKGLALEIQLPPQLEPVIGDRLRVEQVLLNLLNNAVKFTKQGKVTLLLDSVDSYISPGSNSLHWGLRLRVVDTGIGIKPDDLPKLFQPFRQIDSGLTRQHEGTGLGLAICRRLAGLMGGEVTVQSTWGSGSTFTFFLPVQASAKHETQSLIDRR